MQSLRLLLKAKGAWIRSQKRKYLQGFQPKKCTRGPYSQVFQDSVCCEGLSRLSLLEGLIQAVPRDWVLFLGGRDQSRKSPLPPQLTEKSCPFICHGVGFLVRFHVQKEFCCSKQRFAYYRQRPLASRIQTTRTSKPLLLIWSEDVSSSTGQYNLASVRGLRHRLSHYWNCVQFLARTKFTWYT